MIGRDLYLGLISGTSVDGIDAALVDFSSPLPQLVKAMTFPIPEEIKAKIETLCQRGNNEITLMGQLDQQLAVLFSDCVKELLATTDLPTSQIKAIGSHGQTIRHEPDLEHPFTLQITDPNLLASLTGITTIADFRRKDMAEGGQGAPLVCAFHEHVARSTELDTVVVNIGGISNVTFLWHDTTKQTMGFDTGPGNRLMDIWIEQQKGASFDELGKWASTGHINEDLLQHLMQEPYLQRGIPKSTGREIFNSDWLGRQLENYKALPPEDVQATLTAFTAASIIDATKRFGPQSGRLLICGGGAQNDFLMQQLSLQAPEFEVSTTELVGIDPDYMEAMAFAWLAKRRLEHLPGNVPTVTGAQKAVILGGIYAPD